MERRPAGLGPLQVVLEETAAEINKRDEHASPLEEIRKFVLQGNGDGPKACDPGAENIGHAGELIAKSVREMFEEVAKRHERAASVARQTGETIAASLERASSGAKTTAQTLSLGTSTMSGTEPTP